MTADVAVACVPYYEHLGDHPTLLSLFDGSGGFPLAASMCGITPIYASEIEPYPIAVTTSRFPNMRHIGDVSKIKGSQLDPVHIITFGSPCQDLSVAGKRAGLKHSANGDDETTRSGLFMEAVRIIKEMRRATDGLYPRFAIWENVPGAFSSNKGEDFRVVLEELIKICEPGASVPSPGKGKWSYADAYVGDGWSLAYRTLDAQYWGVPQRRRRIYLVLDLRGECAHRVLFERKGLRGHFEESGWQRKGTAPDGQGCTATANSQREGGCVALDVVYSLQGNTIDRNARQNGSGICEGVSHTINAVDRHGVCYSLQGNMIGRADKNGPQGDGINENVCFTVNTIDRHAVAYAINGKAETYHYIVRRITPTECARLQGFPDNWGHIIHKEDFTDEEYSFWLEVRNTHASINGKTTKEYTKQQMLTWYNKLHTDSAEYKMWGNGIALPTALYVMQGIADEIIHG